MQQIGQDYVPLIVFSLMLIGISALIAAKVSTRRLGLVMLLWIFAPAILMAIVLGLGNLMSPPQGSGASNLVFGVMLIGMFVVVPWFVVCGIGFLIGFVIRRRNPPVDPPAAAAPPPTAPRPAAATPPPLPSLSPPPSLLPQRYLPADAPAAHLTHASPDGSIRVDIDPSELGPHHWVNRPRVIEIANGRILCDLLDSDWEADAAFPRERSVWLGLRRYRSPGYLFAQMDLDEDRYRIALDSIDRPDEEGRLGDISGRLEAWWQHATARARANAPAVAPTPQGTPFAAWRSALVILVGALVAIAALTYLSETYDVDPPHVPIIHPGFGVPR